MVVTRAYQRKAIRQGLRLAPRRREVDAWQLFRLPGVEVVAVAPLQDAAAERDGRDRPAGQQGHPLARPALGREPRGGEHGRRPPHDHFKIAHRAGIIRPWAPAEMRPGDAAMTRSEMAPVPEPAAGMDRMRDALWHLVTIPKETVAKPRAKGKAPAKAKGREK
jgi:hypothetical protein